MRGSHKSYSLPPTPLTSSFDEPLPSAKRRRTQRSQNGDDKSVKSLDMKAEPTEPQKNRLIPDTPPAPHSTSRKNGTLPETPQLPESTSKKNGTISGNPATSNSTAKKPRLRDPTTGKFMTAGAVQSKHVTGNSKSSRENRKAQNRRKSLPDLKAGAGLSQSTLSTFLSKKPQDSRKSLPAQPNHVDEKTESEGRRSRTQTPAPRSTRGTRKSLPPKANGVEDHPATADASQIGTPRGSTPLSTRSDQKPKERSRASRALTRAKAQSRVASPENGSTVDVEDQVNEEGDPTARGGLPESSTPQTIITRARRRDPKSGGTPFEGAKPLLFTAQQHNTTTPSCPIDSSHYKISHLTTSSRPTTSTRSAQRSSSSKRDHNLDTALSLSNNSSLPITTSIETPETSSNFFQTPASTLPWEVPESIEGSPTSNAFNNDMDNSGLSMGLDGQYDGPASSPNSVATRASTRTRKPTTRALESMQYQAQTRRKPRVPFTKPAGPVEPEQEPAPRTISVPPSSAQSPSMQPSSVQSSSVQPPSAQRSSVQPSTSTAKPTLTKKSTTSAAVKPAPVPVSTQPSTTAAGSEQSTKSRRELASIFGKRLYEAALVAMKQTPEEAEQDRKAYEAWKREFDAARELRKRQQSANKNNDNTTTGDSAAAPTTTDGNEDKSRFNRHGEEFVVVPDTFVSFRPQNPYGDERLLAPLSFKSREQMERDRVFGFPPRLGERNLPAQNLPFMREEVSAGPSGQGSKKRRRAEEEEAPSPEDVPARPSKKITLKLKMPQPAVDNQGAGETATGRPKRRAAIKGKK